MLQLFSQLRGELENAPNEVKESFNNIVKYFQYRNTYDSDSYDSYYVHDYTIYEVYAVLESILVKFNEDDLSKLLEIHDKIFYQLDVHPQDILTAISGAAEGANYKSLVSQIKTYYNTYWKDALYINNKSNFDELSRARKRVKTDKVLKKLSSHYESVIKKYVKTVYRKGL